MQRGFTSELFDMDGEKICPVTLQFVGRAAFGNQWQTPLAKEMHVNSRTMRRWAVTGAPIQIGEELREIVVARMDTGQMALALLAGYLRKKPHKLRVVK
jgi:hypothetical protein